MWVLLLLFNKNKIVPLPYFKAIWKLPSSYLIETRCVIGALFNAPVTHRNQRRHEEGNLQIYRKGEQIKLNQYVKK